MSDREREIEDQLFEQRLDAGVSELQGRVSPPDVTAAVMARLDEVPGDEGAGASTSGAPPRTHRLLKAAVALFGLGAVLATFWIVQAERPEERELRAVRQDPQRVELLDLPYVVVESVAEVGQLPQDTLAVELRGLGFAAVDALRERAPAVRKLLLRGAEVDSAAVYRALWLRDLQLLDIQGCRNVRENVIAELAQDPTLLQVVFDGQEWLARNHLQRLGRAGIEPVLPSGHPMTLTLAEVLCDVITRLRERQAAARGRTIAFVQVHSRADIEALDPGTLAIDGIGLDDDAVAALVRLPRLRHLALRAGVQARRPEKLDDAPVFVAKTDDSNRGAVTDDGLAALAELRDLESVWLAGTVDIRGPGLRHLAGLPKLSELWIAAQDTSDAGLELLPGFPALRRLRLEANHGFSSTGFRAVTACRRLESLVLVRCPQLGAGDLARIGGMPALRELRIRWPRGVAAWRNDEKRSLDELEQRVLLAAVEGKDGHVIGAALPQIVQARGLEILEISVATVRDNLGLIGDLPNLQELVLARVEGVTSKLVSHMPAGLRVIDLSGCEGLDRTVVERICHRFRRLEELRLRSLPRLDSLAGLEQLATLRRLEVAFCARLGPPAAETLEQCTFLHWLDASYCPELPTAFFAGLREHGVAVKQQRW